MNCRKVQNLMSAYVDCELSGVDMLAVRRHLSECGECSLEFESLLTVKRAFGNLPPKRPAPHLAERICLQLGQVYHPAHERVFAALRKHLTVFPSKLRLAAVGVGVFAVLLMLRSGPISTNNYAYIPVSAMVEVSGPAEQEPVRLFPATSVVEAASFDMQALPQPPMGAWHLSKQPERPPNAIGNGNLLPVRY